MSHLKLLGVRGIGCSQGGKSTEVIFSAIGASSVDFYGLRLLWIKGASGMTSLLACPHWPVLASFWVCYSTYSLMK